MILRAILFLLCLVCITPIDAAPDTVHVEPVGCLHIDAGQDSLYFPGSRDRYQHFYAMLDTLLQTGQGNLNILHIGGSHVQAGDFSGRVRDNLSFLGPNACGTRGLLFPFHALRTKGPLSDFIFTGGEWHGSRCVVRQPDQVLGLSGASIQTYDTLATISLVTQPIRRWPTDSLRLLGQASSPDVQPVLVCGLDTIPAKVSGGRPGYVFPMPESDTCTIAFVGLGHDSLSFTVRGLLPECSQPRGITYTESGINGASVPAWLRCDLFQEELSLLPPNLVVFGIGINDANVLPQNFDPSQFKENYRQLIHRIQAVTPDCCFLFITNNDCWFNVRGRRRQFNTNTEKVEQAMVELALEFDGAVFNVFRLMGGFRSSNDWVRAGLQRPDHIHFSRNGYQLWGDLLYNALVRDYMTDRIP